MFIRVISVIFAISFIIFAYFQYDDPDAAVWIGIYGVAALIAVFAIFGMVNKWVSLIAFLGYLAGAIYHWPTQFEGLMGDMAANPNIELARESLGLLVVALAMIIYTIYAFRHRRVVATA